MISAALASGAYAVHAQLPVCDGPRAVPAYSKFPGRAPVVVLSRIK
jgi:hypothetical protein